MGTVLIKIVNRKVYKYGLSILVIYSIVVLLIGYLYANASISYKYEVDLMITDIECDTTMSTEEKKRCFAAIAAKEKEIKPMMVRRGELFGIAKTGFIIYALLFGGYWVVTRDL